MLLSVIKIRRIRLKIREKFNLVVANKNHVKKNKIFFDITYGKDKDNLHTINKRYMLLKNKEIGTCR